MDGKGFVLNSSLELAMARTPYVRRFLDINKIGDMLAKCLYSVVLNLISDNIRCGINFISLNFDG